MSSSFSYCSAAFSMRLADFSRLAELVEDSDLGSGVLEDR
jgi:hypothetical protein